MSAESIRKLAKNLPEDEAARLEIYRAARELTFRAEPPRETGFRLFWSNGVAAAGVIAVELGLFQKLAKDPSRPLSLEVLSKETGAESLLLLRILRALAAWGYVAHVSPNEFQATNNTIALTSPFAEGAAYVQTQFSGPIFNAFPDYLKEIGHKNPSNTADTAFHRAYKTSDDIFEWFGKNPYWSEKVMGFMSHQRLGQQPWMATPQFLEGFDVALSDQEVQRGRAQFVDIGGAAGHQCVAFREHFPHLKGAVILQDLPFIADLARKNPRVAELNITVQDHDFLTPQTAEAKESKIFYIRNVLHDWPDGKNSVILKHIRDAMANDSILIIDEMIVPDVNVARSVAAYDLVVGAMPAALERNEGMWRDLVERQVGLKVQKIRKYDDQTCDSLIFITKS